MSDKLQPCPFCGDVNPSMQGQTDRTLSYEPSAWVECETCGAQSRGFCRTSEAMEAWNRRATSPARDNEGGLKASTPDGIDLAAQIAHQQEIYCGDCATFGEQSKWSIKSGSILASLIEMQDARAHLSAHPVTGEPAAQADGWLPIESAPKGRIVLVHYKNQLGNGRTMRACYYPPETLESEIEESGWADEGWYEESEAYEYLMPLNGDPTHWQPLPAAPMTAASGMDGLTENGGK